MSAPVSYSQNGEDLIMMERFLHNVPASRRVYIEMGALDGVRYSNTKALEEAGWRGILIEPNPAMYEQLCANRPGNVLSDALVGSDGETQLFEYYANVDLAAVSSVRADRPERLTEKWFSADTDNEWLQGAQRRFLRSTTKRMRSLSSVVRESGFDRIGFFSLDVEGYEYNVLASYDWSVPIDVILVEENGDERVDALLRQRGFRFEQKVTNNQVWVTSMG